MMIRRAINGSGKLRRYKDDADRRKSRKNGQPLTAAERRRVDKLLARVNDANRGPWRPPDVETR